MKKFSNKAYWNEYKASVKIIIFMTIMGELFKQYFINSLEHHPFKYGILYFIYSTLIFLFLFDTLHYWTHRFLHLPWFYRHFHLYHHLLYPVISIGTLSISFSDALIIGQISLWGPDGACFYFRLLYEGNINYYIICNNIYFSDLWFIFTCYE